MHVPATRQASRHCHVAQRLEGEKRAFHADVPLFRRAIHPLSDPRYPDTVVRRPRMLRVSA
eukprot:385833-Rhodomonas_salina.5